MFIFCVFTTHLTSVHKKSLSRLFRTRAGRVGNKPGTNIHSDHKDLASQFSDPDFRREYLLCLIEEESMTVVDALRQSIKSMGIKEFSELVNMPASNISRVLSAQGYKLSTVEKMLAAFGTYLSVCSKD